MARKPQPTIKASVTVKASNRTALAEQKPTTLIQTGPTPPATASPPLLSQGGEKNAVPPGSTTLQQRRAHFALIHIRRLADEWQAELKKQKEFNSYASAMPFMIHADGLGQTAAFYRRKGPDHTYYRLYKLLGDWLSQPDQPFAGRPDLLEGITESDMDTYLAAQVEAMLFLDWVKKLAGAFLAREEETHT